jgi:hypothetical protein
MDHLFQLHRRNEVDTVNFITCREINRVDYRLFSPA